ncbi:MAG: hypothetical protein ABI444_13645 [Candidatus Kapaibacterium sp.]|jgi:hypothetical protein
MDSQKHRQSVPGQLSLFYVGAPSIQYVSVDFQTPTGMQTDEHDVVGGPTEWTLSGTRIMAVRLLNLDHSVAAEYTLPFPSPLPGAALMTVGHVPTKFVVAWNPGETAAVLMDEGLSTDNPF